MSYADVATRTAWDILYGRWGVTRMVCAIMPPYISKKVVSATIFAPWPLTTADLPLRNPEC